MKPIRSTPVKQRGAALAIGLILLAVASLVTVTSINTGVMQERMAANQDNHARAFMAAEAGGASLVSWINTSGWLNDTPTPTPPSTLLVGNLDGGVLPIITYTMTLQSASWANSPLNVRIDGFARSADGNAVLARTQLLVLLERLPPPAAPSINAPAAISCFGSSCDIIAGSGQGADKDFGTVSGFDHLIPPLDCRGNNCRMQPQGANRTMPAVPPVYLETPAGSSIDVQGGNFDAFQGLNRAGTGIVRDNDMGAARSPGDYRPDPVTGASTIPTLDSVFGTPVAPATSSVPTTSRLESGRTTPTFVSGPPHNVPAEVGIFVINGGSFEMDGNELFVGLIVIRNCGKLTMKGNSNIYGAVIVDATGCPTNYVAFDGSGTPAVRFSRAALDCAANPQRCPGTGPGPGPGMRLNLLRWVEILE